MRIMINQHILIHYRRYIIPVIMALFFTICHSEAYAQEHPPKPIIITLSTNLEFGTFFHGAIGGEVIIGSDGSRSTTGDVYLVGFASSPLAFFIDSNPGTIISMIPVPPVTLTGSAGGSMTMNLGATDPVLPFVTTTPTTSLIFGGTLTVSNSLANPPGNYSGVFFVTFNQE